MRYKRKPIFKKKTLDLIGVVDRLVRSIEFCRIIASASILTNTDRLVTGQTRQAEPSLIIVVSMFA